MGIEDDIIKKHYQELGRKGGSVKSEKKAIASRENGKLGGRPKLKKGEKNGTKSN